MASTSSIAIPRSAGRRHCAHSGILEAEFFPQERYLIPQLLDLSVLPDLAMSAVHRSATDDGHRR